MCIIRNVTDSNPRDFHATQENRETHNHHHTILFCMIRRIHMKKRMIALLSLVVVIVALGASSAFAAGVCPICGAPTYTTYGESYELKVGEYDLYYPDHNERWWIYEVRTNYIVRCSDYPALHKWDGIERFRLPDVLMWYW